MAGRFDSRFALITGGGSGIGRAVAEGFCKHGGAVGLIGRTRSKLESVVSDLPGGSALVFDGCHEDPDFVRQAVREAVTSFGQIDFLFNNAGTYTTSTVSECSRELWQRALAENLSGPFFLTREVLPFMRKRKSGVIINNSSTLGLKPIPGAAPYCVAKAALIMLTRATALEEASHGIRVNAICPGVVDTPIHDDRSAGDSRSRTAFLEHMGRLHPLGRVGTSADVAALTLFLASDDSPWTTGAVITVDGGISLT